MSTALRLLLAFALSLLLHGCGKQGIATTVASTPPAQDETKPVAPTPISAPPPVRAPAAVRPPVVVQPVVVNNGSDASAACGALTQALRKYAMEQRHMPASFQELIAAGYVRGLPELPPGKQYSIDRTHGTVVVEKR
jgi:hypothetical protein